MPGVRTVFHRLLRRGAPVPPRPSLDAIESQRLDDAIRYVDPAQRDSGAALTPWQGMDGIVGPWSRWGAGGPQATPIATLVLEGFIGPPNGLEEPLLAEMATVRAQELRISINSDGGNAYSCYLLYRALRAAPFRVMTHIGGIAGSTASILALAGARITMSRGAIVVVHQSMTMLKGTASEFASASIEMGNADAVSLAVLQRRTGRSVGEVWSWLVAPGTTFASDAALAVGLVDELTDDPVMPNAMLAPLRDPRHVRQMRLRDLAPRSTTRDGQMH